MNDAVIQCHWFQRVKINFLPHFFIYWQLQYIITSVYTQCAHSPSTVAGFPVLLPHVHQRKCIVLVIYIHFSVCIHIFLSLSYHWLVPVAARSKVHVCGHSPAEMVGSIPTGSMDVCLLWVLSGRGLCDKQITCPEESYRLWCIVVCDLETLCIRRPWPNGGCRAKTNKQVTVVKVPHTLPYIFHSIPLHTGCNRRNGPDFGRVFLMLYYTDITQNTYIQSW